MRWGRAAALGAGALLAGCGLFAPKKLPPTPAHYTLGAGYQLNGAWYYPKEQTEYDAAGLAAVTPAHSGFTADGERFDGDVLAASHRTLQLPAVARVTNLDNGRQILVRLNDRGPANPGRLLGLTRHAADLLGAADGTEIRVTLDSAMTAALTDQVGGGPKLAVSTAPRGSVSAESLPPPPGTGQSNRGRTVAAGPADRGDTQARAAAVPDRLPDSVSQGSPAPGSILLRASEFDRFGYANAQAAQLAGIGARVQRMRQGRSERYRVLAGPFANVAAADAALDQARRAGVIDSQLVVEQDSGG